MLNSAHFIIRFLHNNIKKKKKKNKKKLENIKKYFYIKYYINFLKIVFQYLMLYKLLLILFY